MDRHLLIVDTAAANPLVPPVRQALDATLMSRERYPNPELLDIDGASGRAYRTFVNSLVHNVVDPRYLEIGSWKGSTLCSAIYNNNVRALAIDNWSQFGGPADEFFKNLSLFRGRAAVSFIDMDFRAVNFSTIEKFNIYLFDGPHAEKDHYDGLVLVQPALDENFILIVDDWNWKAVRDGTFRAVDDLGLQLDFVAEIRTTLDDTHPELAGKTSDWHNGYCIAVCSKRRILKDLAVRQPEFGDNANYAERAVNVALHKSVHTSGDLAGAEGFHAVDGDEQTNWSSGGFAPQSIAVDLAAPYRVKGVRLTVNQAPAGPTVHHVYGSATGGEDGWELLTTFRGVTASSKVLEWVPAQPGGAIRYIKVESVTSPSWISWRHIEVLA